MLDLAEIYLRLVAALAAEPMITLNRYAGAQIHRKRVQRLADQLRDTGQLPAPSGTSDILSHALAIHEALADLDPAVCTNADVPAALRTYRERLLQWGTLLQPDIPGALLISRTLPTRPRSAPTTLAELLPRLRHLDAAARKRMTFTRVNRADDLDPELGRQLRIAAVPMLAERDDVTFSVRAAETGRYYTAAPNRSVVISRMAAALAQLDSSGAHIGMLPEASCDEQLLRDWRNICRTTPVPADSPLTFLLVGTGPITTGAPGRVAAVGEATPNRAAIIHRRTGELLLLQDKQQGFSMDAGYLKTSHLDRTLGLNTLDELLPTSPALNLLDSTIGRVAVLICEDLGRVATVGADVVAAAASLVLAPILAIPMQVDRWQERAGKELLGEGVSVAVANSLTFGREHLEWDGSALVPVPGRSAITLLVMSPDESEPAEAWSGQTAFEPDEHRPVPADLEMDAIAARAINL